MKLPLSLEEQKALAATEVPVTLTVEEWFVLGYVLIGRGLSVHGQEIFDQAKIKLSAQVSAATLQKK